MLTGTAGLRLIRLSEYIINPNLITAIALEGGSCTVHFCGGTTPPIKLHGAETSQLLAALRSVLAE